MPTFEEPKEKMIEAFAAVRSLSCHSERLESVDIKLLAAYAARDKDDEPRGEALSSRGRPILGKIRITTLEDRVAGSADVRVILHGDRWGSLSAAMQRSVLDDCITQIEVLVEDGKPKLDDHGRPKLRKRAWDFEFAGFNEVAERNGRSSVEVHNFRVLFNQHGQTYLPFFDDGPIDNIELAARPKPKPIAEKPKAAPSGYARGKLGAKALRELILRVKRPETILAIARLELENRPRKDVIAALKNQVMELRILPDYRSIENGKASSFELDMAAAVLLTTPSGADTDLLDRLVPECRDPMVLSLFLDDERSQGEESRTEVIQVLETQLATLDRSATLH